MEPVCGSQPSEKEKVAESCDESRVPGQRLREGIVEDRWEGSIPTRPCLVLLPSYRVTASGHWEPMSIGASHVKMVESVIGNGEN